METIGFCENHEDGILGTALNYSSRKLPQIAMQETNISGVISYLENGSYIFGLTLGLFDEDDNVIGRHEILSDGYWIWPKYYAYYIKRKKVDSIVSQFYDLMKSIDFVNPTISELRKRELKEYIWSLFMKKIQI